jgi:molybdenum ABC transporter molybdate-binding protein
MWFRTQRIAAVITVFFLTALLFCSCSQEQSSRLSATSNTVFVRADVSLKSALEEIAENFSYVTNYRIRYQFAPSSQMLDVTDADSVDIFIFANDQFVESARQAGVVDSSDAAILAYAVPCLIVPRFNPHMITNLGDLENPRLRIGIADPNSDVLGAFSLELLRKNRLLDDLSHRLIYAGPSAKDLAERVAKSQIDVAVSWTASVNWYPESFDVLLLIPQEIPRIAAICAARSSKPVSGDNADRLMTYLKSDRCANIFRNWGYLTSDSDIDMYAPTAAIGGKPEF